VCIAIVDDGGHLIYFKMMERRRAAWWCRSEAQLRSFGRPSKLFEEGRRGRNAFWCRGGAAGGGLPITVDG
jgi:hypothetical protein